MFSLTCSQRVLDLVACGYPLKGGRFGRSRRRSVLRRGGGVRCRVSSTKNVNVESLGPPIGVNNKPLVSGTGPIQMSSLLEVVSKDLQQLNNNLKSLSALSQLSCLTSLLIYVANAAVIFACFVLIVDKTCDAP